MGPILINEDFNHKSRGIRGATYGVDFSGGRYMAGLAVEKKQKFHSREGTLLVGKKLTCH